jgi:hypothetical protein
MYNIYCFACHLDYSEDLLEKDIFKKDGHFWTKCGCGADAKILGIKMGGHEPLKPYWSENIDKNPIYITSREQRRALMKKNNLEIPPYKKIDIPKATRDANGHKLTAHEFEKIQQKNLLTAR